MYKIQTLNKISAEGAAEFPRDEYEIASQISLPDAILVRSAEMGGMEIPATVKAVARAGAGTNNIPVSALTGRGIAVFNTPGANANAVKELAVLSLLLASRNVIDAARWTKSLAGKGGEIPELAEKGKGQFVGPEISGKTLGVIGLGAVGALLANTAMDMGMKVIGFDPFISIESAWHLNSGVTRAENLETLLSESDYVSIHVPQIPETKGLINADKIKTMKKGARVINLARGGLVVNGDIIKGLDDGKIACFVTDFAAEELLAHPKVICLPHLGASTPEAEENCAKMAVKQLRNFLETGAVKNSVNFPTCKLDEGIPEGGMRLCIANKNVPNMVGQITTILAETKINISAMVNQKKGDLAYNIIDIDIAVPASVLEKINSIDGVLSTRAIGKSWSFGARG
ncbi:MAG: 3-phosphoglycerate dehydrogenase family protein [Treponemataceae bacterium]|nr:MAG: 3-phosphoglycerate dehydrogenase family protein [Treponemataceae bacterium]